MCTVSSQRRATKPRSSQWSSRTARFVRGRSAIVSRTRRNIFRSVLEVSRAGCMPHIYGYFSREGCSFFYVLVFICTRFARFIVEETCRVRNPSSRITSIQGIFELADEIMARNISSRFSCNRRFDLPTSKMISRAFFGYV